MGQVALQPFVHRCDCVEPGLEMKFGVALEL